MVTTLVWSAVIIVGLMLVTWFISGMISNAGIVDISWGLGFVLVAWTAFLTVLANPTELMDEEGQPLLDDAGEIMTEGRISWVSWLLVALVSLWGLRLAVYLWRRNVGKPEDYRYAQMRKRRGPQFWVASLWTVFGLQGVLMFIIAFPVMTGVEVVTSDWATWQYIVLVGGMVLWGIGLFFELVGDWQLARFKANPDNAGQTMDRGLWKFTRHPNYFGDFLVWWGIFMIAWSAGHWWTVFSPVLMSVLLIWVSGVRMLEKTIAKRRKGWEEYAQRTNAFFPWFPHKSKPSGELPA